MLYLSLIHIYGIPVGLKLFHLRLIGGAVFIELPDVGVRLLNVLVHLILCLLYTSTAPFPGSDSAAEAL